MFLIDLLKQNHSLEILQGVEKKLLKGRRQQKISGFLLMATLLIELVVLVSTQRFDIIRKFPAYFQDTLRFVKDLFSNWSALQHYSVEPVALLFYLLFILLLILLFFIIKNQFIKLSEDPFQYTFWIEPFMSTQLDEDKKEADSLSETQKSKLRTFRELLHHDLIEKMSERIGRLSLLHVDKSSEYAHLSSHIHIEGYISLRQESTHEWIIHIRPRVCIGSFEGPFTITNPVKLPVEIDSAGEEITVEKYNQAMERVYSSVVTEIYQQIKKDLEEKIKLFPTKFLKAVALYNEAKDFAQSNTIDAYDLSLELYEEASRYLRTSFRSIVSRGLYANPYLHRYPYKLALSRWLIDMRYHYVKSKIYNGYAQCKIYKQYISSFTGRESDPLYELPGSLIGIFHTLLLVHNSLMPRRQAVNPVYFKKQDGYIDDERLEPCINEWKAKFYQAYVNIPTDSWWRKLMLQPSESLMKQQRNILFETLVVLSLVYVFLKATYRSKQYYSLAESVAPRLSKNDHLFLLTSAELQGNIANKLSYLAQSIKIYDRFEVTQFMYARWRDLNFRMDNEIYWERCKSVIEDYEDTLRINPGNIAALASQGYLCWLTDKLEEAEEKFVRGKDIKAIVKKTFIAPINYGLARIAMEKGQFNKCYDLYQEAIFSEPVVAAYSDYYLSKKSQGIYYYDLIGPQMLDRYRRFLDTLHSNIEHLKYRYQEAELQDLPLISQYLKACLQKSNRYAAYIREFRHNNRSLEEMLLSENAEKPIDEALLKACIVQLFNTYARREASNGQEKDALKIRMLIDTTVPGIRAFEAENTTDIEGEYLSEKVTNGVKSFVYNDFGNACINYYSRFGVVKYNEQAIDAYQQAIAADPNNKVAHFNLANAFQNIRSTTDSYQHLKIARKLDKEWTVPIHDLFRKFNSSQIPQAEEKLQKTIEKEEDVEVKPASQSVKSLKKEASDERPTR